MKNFCEYLICLGLRSSGKNFNLNPPQFFLSIPSVTFLSVHYFFLTINVLLIGSPTSSLASDLSLLHTDARILNNANRITLFPSHKTLQCFSIVFKIKMKVFLVAQKAVQGWALPTVPTPSPTLPPPQLIHSSQWAPFCLQGTHASAMKPLHIWLLLLEACSPLIPLAC